MFSETVVVSRELRGECCFDRVTDHNAKDLVRRLLAVDPMDRPSAAQALQHPFFESNG